MVRRPVTRRLASLEQRARRCWAPRGSIQPASKAIAQMRFRVRAKVESATKIPTSPFAVESPPYLLQFEVDQSGRVAWISVERPVEEYRHLLPVLTHTSENHSSLTYPDNPVHSDLIALLQYFESVGSFWCGIKQIFWDRADFDWVPESAAERNELVVWDLRIQERYLEVVTEINAVHIQGLLQRRSWHEHLTVPLAFYREGKNEFERFRYIQAFVNFYFMLEGLFGGGGPNYRVKERFKAAPTLVRAAEKAAEVILDSPRHVEALRRLTRSGERRIDGVAVLEWLVDFRGVLHHYSLKDARPQPNPNNQRDYEAVAFLAMAVCVQLMPHLIVEKDVPEDVGR